MASLADVLRLLSPAGVVTIVGYTVHSGGAREVEAVTNWCRELGPDRFDVADCKILNRLPGTPELFSIRKREEG